MSSPPEGSGPLELDGLIEGPVPPQVDGEDTLRQWVVEARSRGFEFELTFDGGGFSLLADSRPLKLDGLVDLQGELSRLLSDLLALFPDNLRPRLFSTLRSTEVLGGMERQSIYAFTARGVEVRDRKVALSEVPAAKPPPRRVQLVVLAGVAFAVLALASTFVVDYRATWRQLVAATTSIDPTRFELDASGVTPYLDIKLAGTDTTQSQLVLEARKGPGYPLSVASFAAEEEKLRAAGNLRDWVRFQRVVVGGRIRVEFFDDQGKQLGSTEYGLFGLDTTESARLELPVRRFAGAVKLRIEV